VVRLRNAKLARRNDLLPTQAVVRKEDKDREAVVEHPAEALEEFDLESVDVAHLDNLHRRIRDVEQVEEAVAEGVDALKLIKYGGGRTP